MLLPSLVECVEKFVKLILGLATEHRQQLLVLWERYHLTINGVQLFFAENFGLIQLGDKSGMLSVQIVHQEHVMITDCGRMIKMVCRTYTSTNSLHRVLKKASHFMSRHPNYFHLILVKVSQRQG